LSGENSWTVLQPTLLQTDPACCSGNLASFVAEVASLRSKKCLPSRDVQSHPWLRTFLYVEDKGCGFRVQRECDLVTLDLNSRMLVDSQHFKPAELARVLGLQPPMYNVRLPVSSWHPWLQRIGAGHTKLVSEMECSFAINVPSDWSSNVLEMIRR
jgi:hypothetical protein